MAWAICRPRGCRIELGEAPPWAAREIIEAHERDCKQEVEDPCPGHPHQGLAPTGLASGEKVCPEDGGHLVGNQESAG